MPVELVRRLLRRLAPGLGYAAALEVLLATLRRSQLLSVGSPAPSFRLTDQHGQDHGFADYRGKPVVLFFYPRDATPG